MLDAFLVLLDCLDDVIEGDQTFDSFVQIAAVLQVGDELHNVVNLALSFRVKSLLFWSFHFLDLLPEVFVIVHEMHFVLRWVEVQSLGLSVRTAISAALELIVRCGRRHCLASHSVLVHGCLWSLAKSLLAK